MRLYRDVNGLPPIETNEHRITKDGKSNAIEYESLIGKVPDEYIDELIRLNVELERAKKGYKVKGGGPEKEFIILNKKNLK